MKKAVLASAIFATLVSGAASAATVYQDESSSLSVGGRAEARFNISDENKSDADSTDSFEDKSRARVNLKGKTEIMDGLGAFGTYEVELKNGKDTKVETRYLFAGLDTQVGAFSYGQQDSAQVILTDLTDILATFGGDAADLIDGNKDKRENNFVYSGSFNDLTVTANYIANDAKDSDTYGISFVYSLPMGLDLGAGYVDGKDDDVDTDQYNITAAYTINDFYVAGLYAGGSAGDADLTAYELAAAYKYNQFTFQGVYNYQEEDLNGTKTDTVDYFALEAIYKFNSNFRAYAGYLFEQLDDTDDQFQAGVRYDF
ncbi:porin [Photobacterium sanctipauli]|uniref:Porin n=1 Tax=Photobacterium sanctipauli TaxID=1342794 RepID=A0A2T3NXZ9_9GAMM|nr:porin [Photobacterium sanctipauli]PSW21112.1 porin [Photobacterium sanctipauli]